MEVVYFDHVDNRLGLPHERSVYGRGSYPPETYVKITSTPDSVKKTGMRPQVPDSVVVKTKVRLLVEGRPRVTPESGLDLWGRGERRR